MAGAFQQRLGGVQFDLQAADLEEGERLFAGLLDVGVDKGAGARADEVDGVFQGVRRDAGINGGLDQLRDGALDVRDVGQATVVDHQRVGDGCVIQQHGAAGGGALAEAGPVVDDAQAIHATFDEAHDRAAVFVDGFHRDPMGEQRAG